MARGDVVAEVVGVSGTSSHTVQPGSGVEWVIKAFAGDNSSSGILRAYDGSITTNMVTGDKANDVGSQVTIPINNAHYLAMRNSTGSTLNMAYFGYITKD